MCQKLQYFTNTVYSSKNLSNINKEKCLEKITCLKLNFIRGGIKPSPAWFQLYPLKTLSSKSCYQNRRFHSVSHILILLTVYIYTYASQSHRHGNFTYFKLCCEAISETQSGCKRTQKILNKICGGSGNDTLKYAILDLVENM